MRNPRTAEDVLAVMKKIEVWVEDDAVASQMENELWERVLRSIRNGTADDPAALAKAALGTCRMPFRRWPKGA